MTVFTPQQRRKLASEQAAEWLALMQGGALSVGERREFITWLCESQLHVAEMLRLGALDQALARFDGWGRIAPESAEDVGQVLPFPPPIRRQAQSPRRESGHWRRWAVAASLVLGVGLALWMQRDQSFHTLQGERREVALADGSVIDMAPFTDLSVRMSAHERRVVLRKGAAYFHVARNPARPFMVWANHARARAVGTAFSVAYQADAVVVTVVEGRVAVGAADAESQLLQGKADAAGTVALVANQQVRVTRGGALAPIEAVDSRTSVAWADGQLVFNNDTVAQIVAQFNRYNRIQMRVSDPELASRRLSGVFRASDPSSFIAFLETAAGISESRSDTLITLGSASEQTGSAATAP
ncbi:MAG: FecR domain-containing protein [Steroidobacteraceae bacterium]